MFFRFLLILTLVFASTNVVYAGLYDSIGNDEKCGDFYQTNIPGVEACATKLEAEGEIPQIEQNVVDPNTGQQSVQVTPGSEVIFKDINIAKGVDKTKIGLGINDLYNLIGKPSSEITKESTCDDIFDSLLYNSNDEDQGMFLKLLMPWEITGDKLVTLCDKLRKMFTVKSKTTISAYEENSLPEAGKTALVCENPTPKFVTGYSPAAFGTMAAANEIWYKIRFTGEGKYFDSEAKETLFKEQFALNDKFKNRYASNFTPDPRLLGIQDTRMLLAADTTDPQPPSSTDLSAECINGNCNTLKFEKDAICVPEQSTVLSIPSNTQGVTKWDVKVAFADPTLSGIELGETEEGEPIMSIDARYNLQISRFLQDPITLQQTILYENGSGAIVPNEAGKLGLETTDDKESKHYALGSTQQMMINQCWRSNPRCDSNPEYCSQVCGIYRTDLGEGATGLRGPIEGEEPTADPNVKPGQPSGPDTTAQPSLASEDCKSCKLKAGSVVSNELITLLEEAGSKFGVPSSVLLGIMKLESGHAGWGTNRAVYQYTDDEIATKNADGTKTYKSDPFCVRNQYCATGPFQIRTQAGDSFAGMNQPWGSCSLSSGPEWSTYGKSSGSANPNPCNIRDAAFAAAALISDKVSYNYNSGDCANYSVTGGKPTQCKDWTIQSANKAMCGYHGACNYDYGGGRTGNYCAVGNQFVSENCN